MKTKVNLLSKLVMFFLLFASTVFEFSCTSGEKPPAPGPKPLAATCVDFQTPTIGTIYENPANPPGSVIFTPNGIKVSVENFLTAAGNTIFNLAKIEMPPSPFGAGQTIRLNNINLKFDFTGTGFPINKVIQIDFLDMGGIENLSINGSINTVLELTDTSTTIAGVSVTSNITSTILGGKIGIVILKGAINEFKIGGQEFWIDNVCLLPLSAICVDFQAPLTIGTIYENPANPPGSVIFTPNGIKVSVENFLTAAGNTIFNQAKIEMPPSPFGTGQTIRLNNINLKFDFTGTGFPVNKVIQIDFLDMGGIENLSINGSTDTTIEIRSASTTISGVSVKSIITSSVTGGEIGTVTFRGAIKEFKIGGQEFWIDNVCF